MNIKSVVICCVGILISVCLNSKQITGELTSAHQKENATNQSEVKTESLNLFDKARNRAIPVALYLPVTEMNVSKTKKSELKIAIISHGYGGKNTDYSFIANSLVARGYLVASIQHELPSDEPLPTTGNPYKTRKPNWERGVKNTLFVIQELKKTRPNLDYKNLLLIGHSNGGDMSMLFAHEHPNSVRKIISLDNRRMPFPRTKRPEILSIRSSDQSADAGVLPTPAEQERYGIKIIKLKNTRHDDMWDGATEEQKQEINEIISSFLEN
ncbi:MAG: alpha/beta hydrolase [Pyrinomonadaceae bacterium]